MRLILSSAITLTLEDVSPWSTHTLQVATSEHKYRGTGGTDDSKKASLRNISPPLPRCDHSYSMVSSPSGDIFVFGGVTENQVNNDTWSFRLSADSQGLKFGVAASLAEATGDVPSPRLGHQSALVDGLLIVWGGITSFDDNGQPAFPDDDSIYLLDTRTKFWTKQPIQPSPRARVWHATCISGHRFIVFGGSASSVHALNDLWGFDLYSLWQGSPEWFRIEISAGSQSPPRRWGHTMIEYGGNLYVFGGGDLAVDTLYNDTWCFDMNTRTWTELRCTGPTPSPRMFHAVALVEDVLYMFGGKDSSAKLLCDTWSFKITEQRWYRLPSMDLGPSGRCLHAMAAFEEKIFFIGGAGSITDQTEVAEVVHILNTDLIHYPEQEEEVTPKTTPRTEHPHLTPVVHDSEKYEQSEKVLSTNAVQSETGYQPADQDVAPHTTPDTITGAMSATEILRYLVTHGCHALSDDHHISHVSEYPISSGGFGDVYRATLRNGDRVGLKCIRILVGASNEGKKFLKHAARELYVWSKCKHPNVLELSGVMLFRDQIAMVSPWVEHGHLRWFISQNPQANRCILCVGIADGVDYMHKSGIVHGDLKPENILVAKGNIPKLTDFGNAVLSEYSLQFSQSTTTQCMSMRWTAPEILNEETKTTQAGDIYAFGMIIFEVITGVLPFAGAKEAVIMRRILAGKVPSRPEEQLPIGIQQADRLWSLINSCWAYDAPDRPHAEEIRNSLDGITPAGLLGNQS